MSKTFMLTMNSTQMHSKLPKIVKNILNNEKKGMNLDFNHIPALAEKNLSFSVNFIVYKLLLSLEHYGIVSSLIMLERVDLNSTSLQINELKRIKTICSWLQLHSILDIDNDVLSLKKESKDMFTPSFMNMFFLIFNYEHDLNDLTKHSTIKSRTKEFHTNQYSDLATLIMIEKNLTPLLNLIKRGYSKESIFYLFSPNTDDFEDHSNRFDFEDSKNLVWLQKAKESPSDKLIIINLIFHELDTTCGLNCIEYLKRIKHELSNSQFLISEVTSNYLNDSEASKLINDNITIFDYLHRIGGSGKIRTDQEWINIISSAGLTILKHVKLPQSPYISTFVCQ